MKEERLAKIGQTFAKDAIYLGDFLLMLLTGGLIPMPPSDWDKSKDDKDKNEKRNSGG